MMKTKILLLVGLLLATFSCKKDKPLTSPQAGLISYFNFDDNLKDQKGYTSDGVKTGAPTYLTGVIGKAVSFNGIDQKIVFSPKMPKANSKISVSFWFKKDATNFSSVFISTNGFSCTSPSSQSKLYFNIFSGGVATGVSLTTDKWNHVVGTYDGNTIKIYVNGILGLTKVDVYNLTAFNTDLVLGYHFFMGDNYWAGSIDELYIYNRALSPAEVTQLYTLK